MIIVMPDGTFGKNAHDLRRKKRISLAKMEELSGIPYLTLYCIENGTLRDINHIHALKLCQVLRREMEDLMDPNMKL